MKTPVKPAKYTELRKTCNPIRSPTKHQNPHFHRKEPKKRAIGYQKGL